MSQERLNHCLILHVHKSLTDKIDLLSVATEFVTTKESPLNIVLELASHFFLQVSLVRLSV